MEEETPAVPLELQRCLLTFHIRYLGMWSIANRGKALPQTCGGTPFKGSMLTNLQQLPFPPPPCTMYGVISVLRGSLDVSHDKGHETALKTLHGDITGLSEDIHSGVSRNLQRLPLPPPASHREAWMPACCILGVRPEWKAHMQTHMATSRIRGK